MNRAGTITAKDSGPVVDAPPCSEFSQSGCEVRLLAAFAVCSWLATLGGKVYAQQATWGEWQSVGSGVFIRFTESKMLNSLSADLKPRTTSVKGTALTTTV
jgi:hypothetical protein